MPQARLPEPQCAFDIDAKPMSPLIDGAILKRRLLNEGGRIDDDVQAAERGDNRLHHRIDLLGPRYVKLT